MKRTERKPKKGDYAKGICAFIAETRATKAVLNLPLVGEVAMNLETRRKYEVDSAREKNPMWIVARIDGFNVVINKAIPTDKVVVS